MTDALMALQAAVYARLSADAELAGLVPGGIADGVGRALPALAFTDAAMTNASGLDRRGVRLRLGIEAVSDADGRKEALAILARVEAVLRAQAPAPAGFAALAFAIEEAAVERAEDGRTWRGRLTLGASLEPEE